MRIKAYSDEGGKLGIKYRDFVYPSNNHHFIWARKELMYSEIIINLAKESDIRVNTANISVIHDKKASFGKGSIMQKGATDWSFMQQLAEKINCTLWTKEDKGVSELYLMDNGSVISKLAQYTFFFVNTDDIDDRNNLYRDGKVSDQINFLS